MSTAFTDASFQDEVMNFKGLVVVDFWAEWCTPCRMMAPALDNLAQKFASDANLKIGKLNVDENQSTAMKYNIMSIPAILFFKNGEVVDTLIGLRPEGDIEAKIKELL